MSYGVDHRRGSDLALLWLWPRPAAVAPIRPLAWEPPYAVGVALKRQNKNKNKKKMCFWSSRCGTVETNLTKNHEVVALIPGLAQWLKDLVLP